MIVFEDLFAEARANIVQYGELSIQLIDIIKLAGSSRMVVRFKEVNSNWRQGVRLSSDGEFLVNGENCGHAVVLWTDTAPPEIPIDLKNASECVVKNVWDRGNGVVDSGHNGAAMIVEVVGSKRTYSCNDGHPNDDFNDIIFELQIDG